VELEASGMLVARSKVVAEEVRRIAGEVAECCAFGSARRTFLPTGFFCAAVPGISSNALVRTADSSDLIVFLEL